MGLDREYELYRKVNGNWLIAQGRMRNDHLDPVLREALPTTLLGALPDNLGLHPELRFRPRFRHRAAGRQGVAPGDVHLLYLWRADPCPVAHCCGRPAGLRHARLSHWNSSRQVSLI